MAQVPVLPDKAGSARYVLPMDFIRFDADWRSARICAGMTLAPLTLWAVGTLPPPHRDALVHANALPIAALVAHEYGPGTATAPLNPAHAASIGSLRS